MKQATGKCFFVSSYQDPGKGFLLTPRSMGWLSFFLWVFSEKERLVLRNPAHIEQQLAAAIEREESSVTSGLSSFPVQMNKAFLFQLLLRGKKFHLQQ